MEELTHNTAQLHECQCEEEECQNDYANACCLLVLIFIIDLAENRPMIVGISAPGY